MEAGKEAQTLANKLWAKLQGLPNADPIDLGGFLILLAFILVIVLLLVLTCVSCCCRKTRPAKGAQI